MSNVVDYLPNDALADAEAHEQEKQVRLNPGEPVSDDTAPNLDAYAQSWSVDQLLMPIDYSQTLLGDRWLERGAMAAMVAPSGTGKSVCGNQAAPLWAIGRPAFHIAPSGPLRVLVVQNEDSQNDTKGAFQGVIQNCGFSAEDIRFLREQLRVVRLVALRGFAAAQAIRSLAAEWKADVLVVNPLMAYVPGKQGEETEVFLREHLQPIAVDMALGVIAIHHTPKIGRQNGVGTGANEYQRQYDAAGRADVVNAFRAIVNIAPLGNGVFKFTADKRGRKIGWVWDDKPTIERYFKHAVDPHNPDLIWWVDSTPEEAEQAAQGEQYQDILKVIPEHGKRPVSRERIRTTAKQTLNIGKNKADDWLKLVVDDGLAEKVTTKNGNGRNEVLFTRAKGAQEVWK